MIWRDISGLEDIKKYLVNLHLHGKIPHALLFKGEDGTAVLPLVLGFVQYLYCDNPQDIYPCGQCKSCKQSQHLFHPGFKLIIPKFSTSSQKDEAKGSGDIIEEFYRLFQHNIFVSFDDILREVKGKNKQAIISVQEIHQVIESVSYSAVGNKYNIVCIWHPEMMVPAAANKLLKTIEEPSSRTLFFLICSRPEELLPTIVSRMQQVSVPSFTDNEIIDYLVKKYQVERNKAQEIAQICNGNINKAIHILNNFDEYIELLNDFKNLVKLSVKYDINEIDNWIRKYESAGREAIKKFLEYALEILHYSLVQNYQLPELIKATNLEKDFISKFYVYAHEHNISKLYELFNDTYHYVTRNANIRIVLNDLFLRCNELFKKKITA